MPHNNCVNMHKKKVIASVVTGHESILSHTPAPVSPAHISPVVLAGACATSPYPLVHPISPQHVRQRRSLPLRHGLVAPVVVTFSSPSVLATTACILLPACSIVFSADLPHSLHCSSPAYLPLPAKHDDGCSKNTMPVVQGATPVVAKRDIGGSRVRLRL